MKKVLLPALIAAVFTSCTKTEKKTSDAAITTDSAAVVTETPVTDTVAVATGDNTETSVDWNGTYTGTLPCASCPGIETTLTLKGDKTYELKEVYQEEKDGKFDSKGTFTFDKSGSYITLNEADTPNGGRMFFVGENQMWMVTKVGDRNMDDKYKLVKK